MDFAGAILLLLLLLAMAVQAWRITEHAWRQLWRWLVDGEEQD